MVLIDYLKDLSCSGSSISFQQDLRLQITLPIGLQKIKNDSDYSRTSKNCSKKSLICLGSNSYFLIRLLKLSIIQIIRSCWKTKSSNLYQGKLRGSCSSKSCSEDFFRILFSKLIFYIEPKEGRRHFCFFIFGFSGVI